MSFLTVTVILAVCFFGTIQSSVVGNHKPIVIAHRGACAYLPEHTLEAKSMAFTMGSDYLEQDLVLTKDNIPIVLHDIYLDEVTDVATKFPLRARDDKRYYAIDFTFEEIKSLKVTERFILPTVTYDVPKYQKRFPLWKSSFQLHSLREEIELIQGLQKSLKQSVNLNEKVVGIYPEIKDPYFHFKENRKNFSEIVLGILAEYNYTKASDPVFLQCFDPFELIRIRKELKSELKLVQLLEESDPTGRINYTYWNSLEGLKNISSFAQGIGPYKDQLIVFNGNKYVKESDLAINAKKLGLAIHPYTFRVDNLPPYASTHDELMRIFINDVKVDGVFADFPDVALDYINHNRSGKVISNLSLLLLSIFMSIKMFVF